MGMEMMMTSPTNSVVLSSLGKDTRYTIRVRVVGVNMAETSEYSTGVLARTSEDGEFQIKSSKKRKVRP